MVRNLEPDELVWFMRQALAFVGHADPQGLALRLNARLRNALADAERCYVHARGSGQPTAGVYLEVKGGGDGARKATVTSPWHDGDPDALRELVERLIEREEPEAIVVPLHLLGEQRATELHALLAPLGFERDELRRLRFELTDVPPLGLPLVLEAWQPVSEPAFRRLYETAEGVRVSDARWSFMKRRGGPFQPDLWFLARETLDQEPVGYAFTSASSQELDAAYELTAVGVLQGHRLDSEMLRRLVVTVLRELAGHSPVGVVDTTLSSSDPKLVAILESIGFEALERTAALVKLPT